MTIDEIALVEKIVREDIYYNVSWLISELAKTTEYCDDEDLLNLLYGQPDYKSAAYDEGYRLYETDWNEFICLLPDDVEERAGELLAEQIQDIEEVTGKVLCKKRIQEIKENREEKDAVDELSCESGRESQKTEELAWQEVCQVHNIEPYENEILEHWLVSDWLSAKLAEQGETIGEFLGLTIWGRTTSGQSISMDSVIKTIAKELNEINNN